MTNIIPRAVADVELQLASAISVGSTSFTLNSASDDDGNALPAGLYCFTIDSGNSNKEYLIGQLNGVNVTSVKTVSRQGVETSGAARAHRVGAPAIVTNFATLQRVADILRGALDLDGASPVSYDAEPTLADRKELATVGYVLDTVSGGTIAFDQQTVSGTAGATFSAGDLVYLDEVDQEWKLCDADTAATVEGVMRGIALGAGSDGVAISGGVHLQGSYTTTGLTAGALYYASNTAGGLSTSAGTTKHIVGVALSTTRLWVIPHNRQTLSTRQIDALAGGGDFGTPSSTNKFVTQARLSDPSTAPVVRTYLNSGSPHTWTKPSGLKYIVVEAVGGGGGGSGYDTDGTGGPAGAGAGGGYAKKLIPASSLGTTETATVGAAGSGGNSDGVATVGTSGGNTTFGSHVTANGGGGGTSANPGAGGTATGGDINITGSRGDDGNASGSSRGGQSVLGFGSYQWALEGILGTDYVNGSGYGYGGAGGLDDSNADGRNGGGGVVIVTEYYS